MINKMKVVLPSLTVNLYIFNCRNYSVDCICSTCVFICVNEYVECAIHKYNSFMRGRVVNLFNIRKKIRGGTS